MAERFDIDELVRRAQHAWAALTPEQQAAMRREQRRGYVVSEAGWGIDAQEQAYRAAYRSGDTETLARLQAESMQRMKDAGDRFDREYPPHG